VESHGGYGFLGLDAAGERLVTGERRTWAETGRQSETLRNGRLKICATGGAAVVGRAGRILPRLCVLCVGSLEPCAVGAAAAVGGEGNAELHSAVSQVFNLHGD